MGAGNFFVNIFLSYYTVYFLLLINKKYRTKTLQVNAEMEKLRAIKIKTVEEQKRFINLKYPKSEKFRLSFKGTLSTIGFIVLFGGVMFGWTYFFNNIVIVNLKLWHGILIVIIFPIMINLILKKWGLHKNSILDVLK